MNAEQEMSGWRAWHEACAFGLIGEEERVGLQKVVGDRFRSRVKRLNAFGSGLPLMDDLGSSHLFESWCALHQRRDGKHYKDWLMTRGRRDVETIQSGVMLLVRNVVREWVKESHVQVAEMSLDESIKEASGMTLGGLLPSEGQDRTEEQSLWIEQQGVRLKKNVGEAERAVLLLRAEGRTFSHPQVKQDTGFGKTKLHETHRELLMRMAEEVKADFPGIEAEEASGMVLDVLDLAGREILMKISAET